jgi:hypothetical protein
VAVEEGSGRERRGRADGGEEVASEAQHRGSGAGGVNSVCCPPTLASRVWTCAVDSDPVAVS